MKKLSFAALASLAFATPALADDATWTGPYAGISAGWNTASSESTATLGGQWANESSAARTFVTSNMSTKQTANNGNIGLNVGYNYQTGGAVIGLELEAASIGGSNVRSTSALNYTGGAVGNAGNTGNPVPNYTFTNTIDPKSLLAAKVRIGAVLGSSTLVYATGGWAGVYARHGASITSNGSYVKQGSLGKTHNGFIVGAGLEQRISSNVSVRAEYDYTDQGDVTYSTTYAGNSAFQSPAYTETMTQDLKMHLIRVGVAYHF